MIAEALTDGGVMMGLPRPLAQKLVVNTLIGSSLMIQETGRDPTSLKVNFFDYLNLIVRFFD